MERTDLDMKFLRIHRLNICLPSSLYSQEILDQIADVDLVLNFKSSDKDPAKSELGNGLNLQSQGSWIRSFPEASALKEKLRTYAEQVWYFAFPFKMLLFITSIGNYESVNTEYCCV